MIKPCVSIGSQPIRPEQVAPQARGEDILARPSLSTASEVWPELGRDERRQVLRDVGILMRRLHGITLPGFGALDPVRPEGRPLQWVLADELGVRGFPLVASACPAGLGVLEGLLETIPEVCARSQARAVYTHSRLSLAAFLCAPGSSAPTVIGLATPGEPGGWPPESDLAQLQLAHGALGQPLHAAWFSDVLEGYGARPDPVLLAFFRSLHLLRQLTAVASRHGQTEACRAWLEAAQANMQIVHAAYDQRMRAAAVAASLPRQEALALRPKPIRIRGRAP